jgi:hypothetical protein
MDQQKISIRQSHVCLSAVALLRKHVNRILNPAGSVKIFQLMHSKESLIFAANGTPSP